jgi:hypothetical protein
MTNPAFTEDVQNAFCENLKADEAIFKPLLGMTQSNFYELLQEVTPIHS